MEAMATEITECESEHAPRAESKSRGKVVLMVDSNRHILRAADKLFQRLGLRLVVAASCVDVLVQLMHERPLLILMDQHSPELDALEVCALLRQHPRFADLPLVMMHEELTRFDELKAEALGVSALLAKPFGRADLQAVLARVQSGSDAAGTCLEEPAGDVTGEQGGD